MLQTLFVKSQRKKFILPSLISQQVSPRTLMVLMSSFTRIFGLLLEINFFQPFGFFLINLLCRSLGAKRLSLLFPKKDKPKLVLDFSPISLCNVCFKIISKILTNCLKLVLPHVIVREQAGFVSSRCSFDNIIALQEIVHTLENGTNSPPRMIIKLDIEKAYDTLNWSVILAILSKMNFPSLWLSWISTCLHSCSFSLLINGNPSPWFSSSRGVHQGDPISSYPFILVSQILTNMLNFGLTYGMIPGFYSNLNHNFNHLMYVDDLIIVTQASRNTAHNINLCLSIYSNLTSQHSNLAKSEIYFPS